MLNTHSSLIDALREKDYRDGYTAAQLHIGLPFQIRALRTQRGWTQAELATRAGMTQPRIAEMEQPGTRRLTIDTLLRLARAFDIGLQVRFMLFSELIEWAESVNPEAVTVPSFAEELWLAQFDAPPLK